MTMMLLKAPLTVLLLSACTSIGKAKEDTILEVAKNADFSTLVGALELTGLDDVLGCERSWNKWWCPTLTAFAPDEAAFSELGEQAITKLTSPEWRMHLRDALLYHVAYGRIFSDDISDGATVSTLNGEKVTATVTGEEISIEISKVIDADLPASNGIVHAVDKVLLPSSVKNNIVQAADSSDIFSTLVTAVLTAELQNDLSAEGPFTVFAPTNDAFSKLGDEKIQELLADPNALKDILLYHVVPGIITSDKLKQGNVDTLLEGQSIEVDIKEHWWRRNAELNNEVGFKKFDILVNNGVIHAIDTVLIPPSQASELPNLVELAQSSESLSTLVDAVIATDLVGTLQEPGPVTVLAPTNSAFEGIDLPTDTDELRNILLYHVIPGKLFRNDLSDGVVEAANGDNLLIDVGHRSVRINKDTHVTAANLEASNGIVHTIDKVLIPPPDIVGVASSNENFSILVEAVKAAKLVEALQGDSPLTVFAPTNAAFAKLAKELGTDKDGLLARADLGDILKYHVVSGNVYSLDLGNGDLDTLLGAPIQVEERSYFWGWFRYLKINGNSNVVAADTLAKNGVIHVIDTVLIPPT